MICFFFFERGALDRDVLNAGHAGRRELGAGSLRLAEALLAVFVTMIQCSTLCTQRKVAKFPYFWCLVFGAQFQHFLEFFCPVFLLCS